MLFSLGVDVEIEKRDAAVALFSLDNPGGGGATSPQYVVVVKEEGAEAEEADKWRDDIDFEGDSDNLGRGEEETALTDGAMDPVGNVGPEDGSTDDEDEIGLIFELEGKETKACLRDFWKLCEVQ